MNINSTVISPTEKISFKTAVQIVTGMDFYERSVIKLFLKFRISERDFVLVRCKSFDFDLEYSYEEYSECENFVLTIST